MQRTEGVTWKGILQRQAEWWREVNSWKLPWIFNDSLHLVTGKISVDGISIGLGGLNSSWGCSEDAEEGSLWLGRHQFQVCDQELAGCDFRIAVMHHPTDAIHESEAQWLKQRLETKYDLLLHGHTHSLRPTPNRRASLRHCWICIPRQHETERVFVDSG